MSRQVIAVFPGTFDPVTLGHEDLVRRSALLFDRVIVAVAVAHHKKTLFSLHERMDLVREVVKPWPNVVVESFSGLVVDCVAALGAQVMVRGVRAVADFDYETQLAGMNRALMPQADTIFLTPGATTQFVSSTLVREIAMLGGEVAQFVSPAVLHALLGKKRSQSGGAA